MSVLFDFGKKGGCRIEYGSGLDTQYGARDVFKLIFHNEEFEVWNVYPKDSEPVMHIDEVVKTMKEFIAFYDGDVVCPKS